MEVSKELRMTFNNDVQNIRSVDVTYEDDTVSGFPSKVSNDDPFSVTLTKHNTVGNEDPEHDIDFDAAVQIQIEYRDGEIETFE